MEISLPSSPSEKKLHGIRDTLREQTENSEGPSLYTTDEREAYATARHRRNIGSTWRRKRFRQAKEDAVATEVNSGQWSGGDELMQVILRTAAAAQIEEKATTHLGTYVR